MNIILTARNPDGSAVWAHKDTLEAFVINNAVDLTFQDIENITATLGRGETWHGGGGASGAYTLEVHDPMKPIWAQVPGAENDHRYKAMLAALVDAEKVIEVIPLLVKDGNAPRAKEALERVRAAIKLAGGAS